MNWEVLKEELKGLTSDGNAQADSLKAVFENDKYICTGERCSRYRKPYNLCVDTLKDILHACPSEILYKSETFKKENKKSNTDSSTINKMTREILCNVFHELKKSYKEKKFDVTQFTKVRPCPGTLVTCQNTSGFFVNSVPDAKGDPTIAVVATTPGGELQERYIPCKDLYINFCIAGRLVYKTKKCLQASGQLCWNKQNLVSMVEELRKYCDVESIDVHDINPSASNKPELVDFIQSFVQNSPDRMKLVESMTEKLFPHMTVKKCVQDSNDI